MQQITKPFRAQWRGSVEGYAVNQLSKLLPRLHHLYDRDDLYQESFEVYLQCKLRYEHHVDNPAWFMSLYKRCLFSRYAVLLRTGALAAKLVSDDTLQPSESKLLYTYGQYTYDDGSLVVMLQKLPCELLEMLQELINESTELGKGIPSILKHNARLKLEAQLL